jgi:hypothetical protein
MLRVTVELVPFGFEERKRILGTIVIANDGTGTHSTGHYDVQQFAVNGRRMKRKRVENHARLKDSVWKLVAKALKAMGHGT